MTHAWLALQVAALAAVVAGVYLLFHLGVALVVGGVIGVVVAELRSGAAPEKPVEP